MADLSKHRGTASAVLAAGVVGLGVIGGATAIMHARGGGSPATTTTAAPAAPVDTSGLIDETGHVTRHVAVKGLARWRPPALPKPLRLAPVVRHGRKVVTVVSSIGVAAPAAPAAPTTTTWSTKTTETTPRTRHTSKPHVRPAKPSKPSKPTTAKQPPATTAPLDPAPAATVPTATTPSTPPPTNTITTTEPPTTTTQPPVTQPPPPTVPTGLVAITGGNVAGRVVTANWAGADPAATTYQWLLCDQDGHACQPIATETAQTYTLKTTDIGKTIRVSAVCGTYSSTSRATDQIEQGG